MKIIDKIIERVKMRELRINSKRVNEDFQIAEKCNEIWITFCGYPVLPASMLKEDPIVALSKIREMHIADKY